VSQTPARDVTQLLRAWSEGKESALDELRRQAERHMRRQAPGYTVRAAALVHEAYLRIANPDHAGFQSRAHFFGVVG